jgi:O-acetyl-ADP-ribose deacetylase (regulator of RNase III)
MFSDKLAIEEYLNNKTNSEELKTLNINDYKRIRGNDIGLVLKGDKKKIKIIYGKIEDNFGESIVNSANELLLGGGGIDGIIHQLGGEKLIEEVLKIPLNQYGARLMEGESVLTYGYCDNYKYFIHTVAPYYDENGNIKRSIMEKCFDSIFKVAIKNGIKEIIIPPIGIGFYGFPILDFAIISMKKICEYSSHFDSIKLLSDNKILFNIWYIIYEDYFVN